MLVLDGDSIMTDYSYEHLSKIFAIDENTESGVVFNTIVFGGKNHKQHLRKPGDPAGSKEYDNRTKLPLAWRITHNKARYQAHRIIYVLHSKIEIPDGFIIDHLDGNPFNNKLDNLKLKTIRENNQNVRKKKINKLGVTGVFLELDNGVETAYTATWSDLESNPCRKRFYFSRYPRELAFDLAVEFRKSKIEELKQAGMKYTDRHGL
jgi:hypothetical protein